ncbi:MAG: hypothetical protein QW594_01405 [Candidatus Woesearchaeota archaeon]
MKMAQGVDLHTLIKKTYEEFQQKKEQRSSQDKQKPYALFVLERKEEAGNTKWSVISSYQENKAKKKKLEVLLTYKTFDELEYARTQTWMIRRILHSQQGIERIKNELDRTSPQELVFSMQKDGEYTLVSLLIPFSDYYQAITWKEATKKYGVHLLGKMETFITCSTQFYDRNGTIRIPLKDLESAYQKVIGKYTSPVTWD